MSFHCLPDSEDDEMYESYAATFGLEELFTNRVKQDENNVIEAEDLEAFVATASASPPGLDIVQIC